MPRRNKSFKTDNSPTGAKLYQVINYLGERALAFGIILTGGSRVFGLKQMSGTASERLVGLESSPSDGPGCVPLPAALLLRE